MSVLLPSTLAALFPGGRTRPECAPLFANGAMAAEFEAAHTLGPFRVLPMTTGLYVVVDGRRPFGDQVLESGLRLQVAEQCMRWHHARLQAEADPNPEFTS